MSRSHATLLDRIKYATVRVTWRPRAPKDAPPVPDEAGILHRGKRSISTLIERDGQQFVRKTYSDTEAGRACLESELLAQHTFGGHAWKLPVLSDGPLTLCRPYLPPESRLDIACATISWQEREEVAYQALRILFDIFCAGYAHRDFHPRNLYWRDGTLYATDFETMCEYPPSTRPAFPECYDLTGRGLESPFNTGRMHYVFHRKGLALQQILHVPLYRPLARLEASLQEDLRHASLSFKTASDRHNCRASRIYGSFDTPLISVPPRLAQRNSAKRLRRFGISRATLCGKSLLDLGSNVGAMLFESQKYAPARSTGIEYDAEKVAVATRVAAYSGLNRVTFLQRDIDDLSADELGQHDVVYCNM
jgi:hypothetical protein